MKSIIYLLIVLMIGSVIYSAIPKSSEKPLMFINEVILESKGKLLSEEELSSSVEIISKRLEDYGITLFSIYPVNEKSQIGINFKNQQNIVVIADLLCQKGQLHFLETYSSSEILKLVEKDDLLYSMLHKIEHSEKGSYSAELGSCKLSDAEKLSDYLNSGIIQKQIPHDAVFAWGKISTEKPNKLSVFTLKVDIEKLPVLTGNKISDIKLDLSDNEHPAISFKFNAEGVMLWQNMTRKNITIF